MEKLDNNLIEIEIFKYLTLKDKIKLSQVNKFF